MLLLLLYNGQNNNLWLNSINDFHLFLYYSLHYSAHVFQFNARKEISKVFSRELLTVSNFSFFFLLLGFQRKQYKMEGKHTLLQEEINLFKLLLRTSILFA